VQYRTIVTNSTYAYRGVCNLSAKGASEIAHSYQSQQTKKATQLLRLIHEKEVKIDSLSQAILNATNLISGALGGHWINGDDLPDEKYHGNVFIADNEDITKAKKVWRWNLGGFGHSNNGVDGPYTSAITEDDSIVANIITASMIKSGRLQSIANPNVYFDLDKGILCASRLVSSMEGATDTYAEVGLQSWTDMDATKGVRFFTSSGYYLSMTKSSGNSAEINTPGDFRLTSNGTSVGYGQYSDSNLFRMGKDGNGNGCMNLELMNHGLGIRAYTRNDGQNEVMFMLYNYMFLINEKGWNGLVNGQRGIDTADIHINGNVWHFRSGILTGVN
jgi:hypothetical protein